MEDPNDTPPAGGNNGEGNNTPLPSGQAPPPSGPPKTVPYDRFKQVNDELKAIQAWQAKQEADQKAAEEATLAEEKKWRELAETRERELADERARAARQRVGYEKGLPAELVDRLVGETPEELAADADRLRELLKPPPAPGVPPPSPDTTPANVNLAQMTAEQIREFLKNQRQLSS